MLTELHERRDAMKHRGIFMCGAFVLLPVVAGAQEMKESGWEIMPSVTLVRYFAGEAISADRGDGPVYVPQDRLYPAEARYSGTGAEVKIRFFNESLPNLAFTLGGGVNWYSNPEQPYNGISPQPTMAGVGEIQHNHEFSTFPLSAGVQVVYPGNGRQAVMLFAGGEFTLNFVDGDIDIRQQAKIGYSVLAGFAVKVFEFGIRYSAFSDMKNLGANIGFRLNPFTL
jgi:hypothetical protein